MDKVRKPSNSVCYTPSSERYRINSPKSLMVVMTMRQAACNEKQIANCRWCFDFHVLLYVYLFLSPGFRNSAALESEID
jgi:hypothetical protein